MTDLVLFYGTLMSGFKRLGRARVDLALEPVGLGWIHAVLFDLGVYPAAIPAAEGRVRGEVHRMLDSDAVLLTLDEIEAYRPRKPAASLYVRREAPVTLDDGRVDRAVGVFLQCAARRRTANHVRRLSRVPSSEAVTAARGAGSAVEFTPRVACRSCRQ